MSTEGGWNVETGGDRANGLTNFVLRDGRRSPRALSRRTVD